MNEKLVIIAVSIGILMLVLGTVTFYLFDQKVDSSLSASDSLLIISSLLVAAAATWVVVDRFRNIRAGLPATDERAKDLFYKAGYYAYMSAIWVAVGFAMFDDLIARVLGQSSLGTEEMAGAVVMISGLVLFGSYFILNRKGNVE